MYKKDRPKLSVTALLYGSHPHNPWMQSNQSNQTSHHHQTPIGKKRNPLSNFAFITNTVAFYLVTSWYPREDKGCLFLSGFQRNSVKKNWLDTWKRSTLLFRKREDWQESMTSLVVCFLVVTKHIWSVSSYFSRSDTFPVLKSMLKQTFSLYLLREWIVLVSWKRCCPWTVHWVLFSTLSLHLSSCLCCMWVFVACLLMSLLPSFFFPSLSVLFSSSSA